MQYELKFILDTDRLSITQAEQFASEVAHVVNNEHTWSDEKFEVKEGEAVYEVSA